ncbi:MAG TPA: SelB C-terminal domain-containing protein [Pseudonocardiaceae bacterium]|nr:SelB C-terminal domain-containing protein [Pseudonocardiaceae bacterium]
MRVIATAGHVDHGKSTLVRVLTGMEPDRWAEEQRRGLTIGLGFVWTELPGVGDVAFVDVPGHERFVPTMLAGVGPVPAVLFVVAADGGWMPQSTEHLAALDALGVRHGVLAVTRADLADPAPVLADATARIGRTGLGTVEAVPVSAATGAGMADLRAALTRLAHRLGDADRDADVRLWVDRVFTVSGAGTVVTGTLAGGTIRTGDELVVGGTPVRVRGLQSLGRDVTEVGAVARVAVNLRASRLAVSRGDALLTPGAWQATAEVDAVLRGDDDLPRELVLHIGSAAVPVRVRPLGPNAARLRLARPLPLRVGDRALLRDPGRHRVVASADILDVEPPELRRRAAERGAELTGLANASPAERAAVLLRRKRFLAPDAFRRAGLPVAGDQLGALRVDPDAWTHAGRRLRALLTEWSSTHPLAAGMPLNAVRQALDLPDVQVAERLAAAAGLSVVDGQVRAGARPLPAPVDKAVAAVEADLAAEPFVAPDSDRLARLGLGTRELAAAARVGRLLRIADGIVLLPDAPNRAAAALAGLPQPFTVSQARQALGTTRRVAVPLLEFLDRNGITEQTGDGTRRVTDRG